MEIFLVFLQIVSIKILQSHSAIIDHSSKFHVCCIVINKLLASIFGDVFEKLVFLEPQQRSCLS